MCEPLGAEARGPGRGAGVSGAEGARLQGERVPGSSRVGSAGWECSVQGGGKGHKISKAQTCERAWSVWALIPV